jgi:hypothetical protein
MPAPAFELDRRAAEALRDGVPAGGEWKAASWTLTHGGRRLLVKDLRYAAAGYRRCGGRFILRHEAKIYQRLAGCGFVPGFHGWLDGDAFVLELVEAGASSRVPRDQLVPSFYEELEAAVAEMHARGVVHLDLRHRSNILITTEGHPVLIDFESSLYVGRGWFGRWLGLPLLAWVDRSAIHKLRLRSTHDVVRDADRKRYSRFLWLRKLWMFGRIWPPRLPGRRKRDELARTRS